MPHLIDKETGLCVVCQRKDLTAVKEGKKYGRQNYDLRKLAIDVITNKNDPNYRDVLERNYIKSNDPTQQHHQRYQHDKNFNTDENNNSSIIITNQLPIKEHLVDKLENKKNSKFSQQKKSTNKNTNDEDDNSNRLSSALEFRTPSPNKWRDTLRKVNLAAASRFIETKNNNSDQSSANKPHSRVRILTPVDIIEEENELREIPQKRFILKKTVSPLVDLTDESDGEIINTDRSANNQKRVKTAMASNSRPAQKVYVEDAPVNINERQQPIQQFQQQQQQEPQYVYQVPAQNGVYASNGAYAPNDAYDDQQLQQVNEIVTGENIEQLTFNKTNPPPGVKRKRRIIVHEFAPPSNSPQPQILVKQQPVRIVVKKPPPTIVDLDVNPGPKRISLKNVQDDNESVSTDTSSEYSSASHKNTKKLLSGFHPYYDEESDILALQCSTCCIGCWRKCSHRCTGCENFLSCPVYCWVGVFLPIFFLLFVALIIMIVYAAHVF